MTTDVPKRLTELADGLTLISYGLFNDNKMSYFKERTWFGMNLCATKGCSTMLKIINKFGVLFRPDFNNILTKPNQLNKIFLNVRAYFLGKQ